MMLLERIEKWRGYKTYGIAITFRYRERPFWVKLRRSIRATSKERAAAFAIYDEGDVDPRWSSICIEVLEVTSEKSPIDSEGDAPV